MNRSCKVPEAETSLVCSKNPKKAIWARAEEKEGGLKVALERLTRQALQGLSITAESLNQIPHLMRRGNFEERRDFV